jgi:ABC-type bacteriocin/lantibiotic exporter with double-glycine peptidase domain
MTLIHRFPPSRGPVTRFLSALVLILIFTLAFFVGTVLFLTVVGILAVLLLVFYLRFWWLRRRLVRDHPQTAQRGSVTLEGEYTVSKREKSGNDDAD